MIHSKEEWTALRTLPRNDSEGTTQGVVVHHTASVVVIGDDIGATLRAIQRYHVEVKRWRDIGYNFMIDPIGDIWVGRGFDKGAHTRGLNGTHLGVCFLGDFTIQHPTPAALSSFADLHDWLSSLAGNFLPVTGHGEHANTACPGSFLSQAIFGG